MVVKVAAAELETGSLETQESLKTGVQFVLAGQ